MSEHTEAAPKVNVTFKRSSTKDAGEGFDIHVAEGADADEAKRVYELALELRNKATEALAPPSLEQRLEASLNNGKPASMPI